ncbi:MAG TPA: hypothetical protein DIS66_07225 [Candidatus Omnitrophica bacterium]|nr:hypothetical protein [Candidatus Omnitrophota bacterium]
MDKIKNQNQTDCLGHGVGLRSEHFQDILERKPKVDWFEAISENFMDTEGKPLKVLEQVRADYPIGLHGTSLSIGSAGGLNPLYLKKLKKLSDRIQPAIISDHLCWAEHGGKRLFDLLPLPFTNEALELVVRNVDQLQNYLGRRILLENVSAYISFKSSEMTEWTFLNEVARKSGCGILLDVNNIYVNSFNHGFAPQDYLNGIDADKVLQYHISGHTDKGKFLFDTHVGEVIQPVWQLYSDAVQRFGDVSSLIEWDTEIRGLDELLVLNEKSREIAKQIQLGDLSCQVRGDGGSELILPTASDSRPSLSEVQSMFTLEMLGKEKTKLAEVLNNQAGDPGIERMDVYAEGYPARISEALAEAYPAISKILGEGAFSDLALGFAQSRSFEHYNLNAVAPLFPDFLKVTPWQESFPFLNDLADLERAVHLAFHAETRSPATPEDFAEKAARDGESLVFQFQTHVFVVRSFWPILDIWSARHLPAAQIKINVENRPQAVLVHRKNEQVFCQILDPMEVAVLQRLLLGETLSSAFDVMTEADDITPVQSWFAKWIALGLMTGFEWADQAK